MTVGPPAPRLLVATANAGKQREYRRLLAALPVARVTPAELGLDLAVAEDAQDYAGNAAAKARAYAAASGLPALADDSGLEVDALNGFPGVRSSRWSPGPDAARVAALLDRLADVPEAARSARFRAAAALAWPDGRLALAEGELRGRIAAAPRGTHGFGYDPIFVVDLAAELPGAAVGERTVAQLTDDEKDAVSHRGRAVRALWGVLTALGA